MTVLCALTLTRADITGDLSLSASLKSAILVERDMAGDVCGAPASGKIAADTRNAATWKQYDIDNWIIKQYEVTPQSITNIVTGS